MIDALDNDDEVDDEDDDDDEVRALASHPAIASPSSSNQKDHLSLQAMITCDETIKSGLRIVEIYILFLTLFITWRVCFKIEQHLAALLIHKGLPPLGCKHQ